MKVIKLKGKQVKAYILGNGSPEEIRMMEEGKIKKTDIGYELFSQEAMGAVGQKAKKGDYFKIDNEDRPYPNEKQWFEKNHSLIEENLYEQLPKELDSWEKGQPLSEEVKFLLNSGRIKIDENSSERYFEAFLWGTVLHAAEDAILLFYEVIRDENNNIIDIDFNFITRKEFEQTYKYC